MKEIFKRLRSKKLDFDHVCEVGVYLPETSNVIDFIKENKRATLVEADNVTVEKIKAYFRGYNFIVYPVAIWDYNGTIKLSKAMASTFVSELKGSPAIANDGYVVEEKNSFEVACKIFSDIDDGSIDLLSIDIEGSEWYVLKYLKSTPKVISIETHGKFYTNPFMREIDEWIMANGYELWYKDGSDSVFIKKGLFEISNFEKIMLVIRNLRIKIRKLKKILK